MIATHTDGPFPAGALRVETESGVPVGQLEEQVYAAAVLTSFRAERQLAAAGPAAAGPWPLAGT
jgi:hypothetical protein